MVAVEKARGRMKDVSCIFAVWVVFLVEMCFRRYWSREVSSRIQRIVRVG